MNDFLITVVAAASLVAPLLMLIISLRHLRQARQAYRVAEAQASRSARPANQAASQLKPGESTRLAPASANLTVSASDLTAIEIDGSRG